MLTLAQYSYRNLRVRRLTTAFTSGGMALVVFVFAAVLMLAQGLEKALIQTGNPDNAVFIRRSSEAEVQSIIEREQAVILETQPEFRLDDHGRRLVAREIVVLISLTKLSTQSPANVTVRGADAETSFALRPQVRIEAGRAFHPGAAEVVIGKNLAERFAVAGIGEAITFAARQWTVVGIMESAGTGFDSEIWGDVDLVMAAFRRPVYSSVIARLHQASEFPLLKRRVLEDPRLTVEVWQETQYYAAQSQLMARFIKILGIALTLIFSLGAVIGAMVTMYAAVATRTTEIGTLRALGFKRRDILAAFIAESLFLSVLGAFAGLACASLLNRITISTLNWQTFSELSFRFTLTSGIAAEAFAFAGVMGFLGGVLPAIQAARLNIVAALRSGT
jgi:ABC-type antimicrobial peptide transport system permease subunit